MKAKKIIEQYLRLPLQFKATIWFAVCQFLQKGINLLTGPFVARMLSTEEYGRASTFNSWENIFLIIVTLSSAHAVMNLCVKHEKRERMLSSLISYNLMLAFIWGVLLFFSIEILTKMIGMSRTLIICLYLYCVFMSQILCWTYVKLYEYSYRKVVAETLICTLGTALGTFFSVAIVSKTAEAKIIPSVIVTVIIGLFIVINTIKKEVVFYDRDVWRFAFGFCVPLLPHYLSEILLMSSDRIMIDRMCGASEVAIYSVAYAVGSLILMVTGAINYAFAPYQYQKIKSKEYKVLAKNTNYIIGFIAFCLCVFMLFGREIVWIFGGQKYLDSISLIVPIGLGVFFNNLFQLFARVQEYYEQKYTIVIASISCAVLNILLNYIFIRIFGYQAAAYTTFVCYFVFCFLHYLFYRMACNRYVGQEIYDVKGLIFISVALILVSTAIGFLSSLYVLKYVIVIVALMVMIWQRNEIIHFIKILREK